ncbi:hypothetical protein PoB_001014100 [Plakobranchus ocellatus]|uniref:Uncharacterized protein n=1 Tax=Plakobranchus ocellatus TaxID=259542 RepID=A0AAV3YMJ6_9GAST|nr:hypothetical protein PoB_001014100 [Plakobranchus ocellatus]
MQGERREGEMRRKKRARYKEVREQGEGREAKGGGQREEGGMWRKSGSRMVKEGKATEGEGWMEKSERLIGRDAEKDRKRTGMQQQKEKRPERERVDGGDDK